MIFSLVLGCVVDAFAAVGDSGPNQFTVRKATVKWTIGGTVNYIRQEYSEGGFLGVGASYYINVVAVPSSHYTYGEWTSPIGGNLSTSGSNDEEAKIETRTTFSYTYTYTFIYRPEITSVSGKAIEADGSPCTDSDVTVTAYMEETADLNGFAPETEIHLHSFCNDPSFYFDHWEKKIGNGNPQNFPGNANCNYTVDNTDPNQNIELTAVYRRKPTITINIVELDNAGIPTGQNPGGTVKINNQQYDGASPFYLEPNSDNNRLEAFPDNIHTFDHWEGDGISTGFWFITNPHQQNPYSGGNNYAVGQTNVTVTVYFRKKPTITITALEEDENGNSTNQIAGGDVYANNMQLAQLPSSAIYTEGDQIQLKAEPAENYCFDRWDATGYWPFFDRAAEATYTVGSSDATVTAVFRKQPDLANYSKIIIDPECGGNINFYRWSSDGLYTAWLQAVPNSPNYEFYRWDLDNTIGNWLLDNTANPTMVSLISQGDGYTLRFQKVKSTIIFSCVDESGQLLSSPEENHCNINSNFTPSAPSIECYELIRWDIFKASGECQSIPTEATSSVTKEMPTFPSFSYPVDISDAEIRAVYRKLKYTITTDIIEQGTENHTGGTVTGAGNFDCGSNVTITATPDDCYAFVKWQKKNGDGVWEDVPSGTNATLSITVEANADYQAVFSLKNISVEVVSNNDTYGDVLFDGSLTYHCGDHLSMTATPNQMSSDCYEFVRWEDNFGNVYQGISNGSGVNMLETTIAQYVSQITYTAVFAEKTSTVNVVNGTITVDDVLSPNPSDYPHCQRLVITADTPADDCLEFDHWEKITSEGTDIFQDTPQLINVYPKQDVTYTAFYKQKTATITITSDGHGTVEFVENN